MMKASAEINTPMFHSDFIPNAGVMSDDQVDDLNDSFRSCLDFSASTLFIKKLDLKHTAKFDQLSGLDGDSDGYDIDELGNYIEGRKILVKPKIEIKKKDIEMRLNKYETDDGKGNQELPPGVTTLDEEDEAEFFKKKQELMKNNEHVRICTQFRQDDGKRSKGLILSRKDGKHYAFKGDYVRDKDGKLEFARPDVISFQRGAMAGLVKRIGASLLSGKMIMNISLPIEIFEAKSELQRSAALLGFAPYFLDRCVESTDPLEQMKLVLAFCVARLHFGLEQRKPFNPILGETFQGFIDGCPVYCEQICHHPPINASQFVGRDYIVEGCMEGIGNVSINTFRCKLSGIERIVIPKRNQTYYVSYPKITLEGLLYGKRLSYYSSSCKILDPNNQLYAKIKFNPEKTSLFSVFHTRKLPYDAFVGTIAKCTDDFAQLRVQEIKMKHDSPIKAQPTDIVNVVSNLHGATFENLVIDDKEYWHIDKFKPFRMVEARNPLPSDCTYRLDGLWLGQGDIPNAQKGKDEMENIQRNDRKLRAKFHPGSKGH